MTSSSVVGPRGQLVLPPRWSGARARHLVGWIAVATVVARLPGLAAAPGIDESGFLMVARQWRAGGTSLYGDYWVDRPPLLITLFRLAALTGGLVPLRLLGCLAAALTVLGVARGAGALTRSSSGGRAAVWAALVAGAWCASPLLGATEVNGELLAAPCVAWGIAWSVEALDDSDATRARLLAVAAGAAGATALLVKQNVADVAVFLVVAVAWSGTWRRLGAVVAGAAAGGGLVVLVTAVWTVLHGTSLVGVYDAVYPFRVAAGRVLAAGDGAATAPRRTALLGRLAVSGVPLLLVLGVVGVIRRRIGGAGVVALGGVLAYDVVSIAAGGSFWSHYLVQLVVPLAMLTGVLVDRGLRWSRALAAVMAGVAVAGWLVVLPSAADPSSEATALGSAVGRVARPGDTIVTLYGHSDVSEASGLGSPYPYLWSLPLKTLDPRLTELDRVLTGPNRPTWLVTWAGLGSWGVDSAATAAIVARDYRVAAVLQGHTVYLADPVQRQAPSLSR